MIKAEIYKLEKDAPEKFIELVGLFEDVFEIQDFIMPQKRYLHQLLKRDDFIVFVAEKENTIIGGLTVYVLKQYYSPRPLAYIFDLAVARNFQRKGIGRKLIRAVKGYCREKGFEEVFVQADKIDSHAVDFYRSTKPSVEEDVSHFYYLFNKKDKG